MQQIAAEQLRRGAGPSVRRPGEASAHSAVIWLDAVSYSAAGSAGFSTAAWQTCRGSAFAQTAARQGAAAACDSVHSSGPILQHAAALASTTEAAAARDHTRLIAALQSVRRQSSLTGPPPSIQHRPQHTSKAEEEATPNGLPFDNYSNDGDRHAAAQQLSEQLEDVHGPPAPAADAVDLQSPGAQSARSVAEAAALLQVHYHIWHVPRSALPFMHAAVMLCSSMWQISAVICTPAARFHDSVDMFDVMVAACAAVQQVNVVQLREKLNRRSQDQPRMAISELLQLCIDS